MTLDMALAILGFAFVMSISPGPSNFLLLASGLNFGFLRSLPLVLGISFGFLSMVLLVGLGFGQLMDRVPFLQAVLRAICGAYVLWLAWKIARSRSFGPAEGARVAEPISFAQAALFQLVNPKAWAVALIVTVSYTDPANYTASLVLMVALFALVNIPAISTWAASGAALRRLLGEGRRIAIFNAAMAALLVASMVPVLVSGLPIG